MQGSGLKQFIGFHIAMILMSTSGVLGRHISLSPTSTIFFRISLAAVIFYAICRLSQKTLKIDSKKDLSIILISGGIMAVHFVTYFHALQLSNVAIGMLSLFTYPVFTAFLEPIVTKSRFQLVHAILGVITLLGIYLLVPPLELQTGYGKAILLGLFSAFIYAIRNVFMKRQVKLYDSFVLMYYQMAAGAMLLLPFIPYKTLSLDHVATQLPYLLILVVITTILGHTLFLRSFRHFSITTASLMSTIIPIYGIILGTIFLSEIPDKRTILGGLCILFAVGIESLRAKAN